MHRFIMATLLVAGVACDRSDPRPVHRRVSTGAHEPANLSPAPALAEGVYQGWYVVGSGTRWFTPCGTDERWWIPRELDEATRFIVQSPRPVGPPGWESTRMFLKVRAVPGATGSFGSLGKYSRELNVLEVLEVREFRSGDCEPSR